MRRPRVKNGSDRSATLAGVSGTSVRRGCRLRCPRARPRPCAAACRAPSRPPWPPSRSAFSLRPLGCFLAGFALPLLGPALGLLLLVAHEGARGLLHPSLGLVVHRSSFA